MSDGDRGKRPAAWIAWAVGFIGLVVALAGVGFGLIGQSRYEQEATQAAAEYARYASDEASQACGVLTGSKQLECMAQSQRKHELQSADKRREYDDLVAQQTSALWTSIMGIAAITGMLLSVVGVWLVYATFRETRRTADEARRSADEAERSRTSYIDRERAHLSFERARVSQWHPEFRIRLEFSNSGAGMASIDAAAFNWSDGRGWPSADPPIAEGLQVKIAADTNGHVTVGHTKPVEFPAVLAGYIRYTTLALHDCRTHFCVFIEDADTSYGGPAYQASKIDSWGIPHDT